jgi:hypothetical protein
MTHGGSEALKLMSSLFIWFEHSWHGTGVSNSLWAFAAFEAAHLLALAVMDGAVQLVGSVIAMFLTGIPLMASLAFSKYYGNEALGFGL